MKLQPDQVCLETDFSVSINNERDPLTARATAKRSVMTAVTDHMDRSPYDHYIVHPPQLNGGGFLVKVTGRKYVNVGGER